MWVLARAQVKICACCCSIMSYWIFWRARLVTSSTPETIIIPDPGSGLKTQGLQPDPSISRYVGSSGKHIHVHQDIDIDVCIDIEIDIDIGTYGSYVNKCTHTCTCMSIHVHTCTHMFHTCTYILHVYIYTEIRTCALVCEWGCICMHLYVWYVRMYVCRSVCSHEPLPPFLNPPLIQKPSWPKSRTF